MIKLPRKIYLTAMKQRWRVSYISSPGKLIIVEQPYKRLVVYGRRRSKRSVLMLINKWVRLKARGYLQKELTKLNKKIKVSYKKLIVGSHEWQWGSYSSTKTISFNYKLVFLPPRLVRHILIHELCHIVYLEHSKRFWALVAKYDKNWKKNKKALEYGNDHIPHWVID